MATGFATFAGSILAERALAHPGHALEVVSASSPAHYFLQPEHALLVFGFVAAVAGVGYVIRSRNKSHRLAPAYLRASGRHERRA